MDNQGFRDCGTKDLPEWNELDGASPIAQKRYMVNMLASQTPKDCRPVAQEAYPLDGQRKPVST